MDERVVHVVAHQPMTVSYGTSPPPAQAARTKSLNLPRRRPFVRHN
jgi:hypothetical protein